MYVSYHSLVISPCHCTLEVTIIRTQTMERRSARYSRCESSFKKRTVNAKETKNSECQKVLSTTRYANSIKFYRLISVHRGAPVIIVFAVPIAARSCSLVLM